MKTSYFAKYRGENGVSIAQKSPKGFKGLLYPWLAPTWQLIELAREGKTDQYVELYHQQVLDHLDPQKIYDDLNRMVEGEPVLLCWEAPGKFCHRHLVAEWLERKLNIKIEEGVEDAN